MNKVIFILGAGVSKEDGAPLMNDFFDRARFLYTSKKILPQEREYFEKIFKAISHLQNAHSKASLDIYNLEAVFNAFEFAEFLNIDSNFSADLIPSLKKLITITIEKSLKFPLRNGFNQAPSQYEKLVDLLETMKERKIPTTILTFNYDIGIDFALKKKNISFDYFLGSRINNAIPLLKLHGSLNWRKCLSCSIVFSLKMENIFPKYIAGIPPQEYISINPKTSDIKCPHCKKESSEDFPFIVPPSWNKQNHYGNISGIWRQAAQELNTASSIFVCGYSLPQTDQFFNNLYALGSMNGEILSHFKVYNPDSTGHIESRFRKLIGTGISDRFHYHSDQGKFSQAITEIQKLINNNF